MSDVARKVAGEIRSLAKALGNRAEGMRQDTSIRPGPVDVEYWHRDLMRIADIADPPPKPMRLWVVPLDMRGRCQWLREHPGDGWVEYVPRGE